MDLKGLISPLSLRFWRKNSNCNQTPDLKVNTQLKYENKQLNFGKQTADFGKQTAEFGKQNS